MNNLEIEITEINNNTETFKWSPGDIRCLISLYTDNISSFDRYPKKKVWSDIAEMISEIRHKLITGDQCDGKFKGLKQMYKKVKDHNNCSGNSVTKWELYDLMDELLNRRPEIVPPVTCGSDAPVVMRNLPSTATSRAGTSTADTNNIDFDFTDIIEESSAVSRPSSLHRKRQAVDDQRNKRHSEKMHRADKFLELFEKLIDKI